MSKNIYIITLQNVRNYGSVLQALATQQIFKELGWEASFFDYYKDGEKGFIKRASSYTKGNGLLTKMIKTIILIPTFIKQDHVFSSFLKESLNIIPGVVTTEDNFKRINLNADVYCTGSDQTWNSGWNDGILPPLFLSFAPQGKKCIAYAASFGKAQLDNWEKEKTKQLLSKYAAISVREESAVKMIHDLNLGIEAVHVLDPTLQIDNDYWRKFSQPIEYNKYCLLYQLNHNPEFDSFALDFAHRKGLKLLRWCNRYDQTRLSGDIKVTVPKVKDFISLIDHADFILTDSFHCTAFSCNLNRPFLSIYPNDYSSRLASLLRLTQLEERHVTTFNSNDYLNLSDIDFSKVNKILESERMKGKIFLINALKD